MNRREDLRTLAAGGTAGALAAGAMVAITPVAAEAPLAGRMSVLIAQASAAMDACGAAIDAEHLNRCAETEAAYLEADAAYKAATNVLLRHRPATVEEAGERLAFLLSFDGPWHGCCPSDEEVALLLASMRGGPEAELAPSARIHEHLAP